MQTRTSAAFVIMPFAAQHASGFEDIIKPAAKLAGVECIRADQDAPGHIHTQMFERLFDSPVVIADISGTNPNVFYELGVVHSLATKTIVMAREDCIRQIPFDIAPYRVLIYPNPPSQPADPIEEAAYRERAAAAIKQLSSELLNVARHGEAIPNPVQDFIRGRSPLTSIESQYLDALGENFERDLLRHAHSSVTHVGLTGAHLTTVLTGYVESETRKTPLSVQILLLDPADTKGWEFVYILREGRNAQEAGIRDFVEENRFIIGKTKRTIERLNERYPWFTGHVLHYSGVPLFWAYMMDESRLFVGHLALNRISSLSLPVYVFVKEDQKTAAMFHYYASTIKSLSGEQA